MVIGREALQLRAATLICAQDWREHVPYRAYLQVTLADGRPIAIDASLSHAATRIKAGYRLVGIPCLDVHIAAA